MNEIITNSMRIPRKDRISIDMDNFNQFQMLKTYFNAKRFSKCVLLYETGGGYHIQILVENRTPEINLLIRNILSDCRKRIDLDEGRLKTNDFGGVDTLFGWKDGRDGITGEILINPLSEQFWGLNPR